MTRRLSRFAGVALVAAIAGLLTACAPTVAMTPAAGANNPKCADISVRLPAAIAGHDRRQTDAQATGAWGDPTVVLLRCGIPPIPPTTQPCVTITSGGNRVDWVLENDPLDKTLRYITYGRTPATEVVIQHGKGGVSDASVLPTLSNAIASIPQQRKCIGTSDAPQPDSATTPTATPTAAPTATPTPAETSR